MIFCAEVLVHLPGRAGKAMKGIQPGTSVDTGSQPFRGKRSCNGLGGQILSATADIDITVYAVVCQRGDGRHDFLECRIKRPAITRLVGFNHRADIRIVEIIFHPLSIHKNPWSSFLQTFFILLRCDECHSKSPFIKIGKPITL